jgi:hypothetical protein
VQQVHHHAVLFASSNHHTDPALRQPGRRLQRALHVVAGLFKRRVDGAIEFFAAHNQPLRTLTSSPIPASRAKAAEVSCLRAPRDDRFTRNSPTRRMRGIDAVDVLTDHGRSRPFDYHHDHNGGCCGKRWSQVASGGDHWLPLGNFG